MDKISVERLKKIHPKLRQEVKQICDELDIRNLSVRFTDVFRTFGEQEEPDLSFPITQFVLFSTACLLVSH